MTTRHFALLGVLNRLRRSSAHGIRGLRRGALWPFTTERLAAIASVVTILGLPAAVYQLKDLRDQGTHRSFQVLTYVDQQLNTGSNVTRDELRDYLDVFEGLADAYDRGQVDLDALYVWHSYYIIKTFRHPEVRLFIKEEQKEGPDFYTGFEDLGQRMVDEEKKSSPNLKRAERMLKER